MTPPQIIAHRGASADAPENTGAAFRRALAIGVDGVELDVHLSADGEPVVIHDHLLERTTDGRGPVGAHQMADLRRLDSGRWFDEAFAGERIPTLAEALDLLHSVRVIVEIKSGPVVYPGIAGRVASVISGSRHGDVTISSFDHPVLVEVHLEAPALTTAVLYVARPIDPVRLAQDAKAGVLHPEWSLLTAADVAHAHAAGLRVEPWTVDDREDQVRIASLGVDGIMTNHPDRLRAALAALGHAVPPPVAL